ncbi:hypothetical protein [Polluticoccus soli]|uniref:hypothetical protein n=1 Tax=Polluticoccus soli TaxID=3034150 RepID=UPI0023E2B515|nr:hypothetical protein [Flavipsychrobacter sp. JY13-12]
MLTQKMITFIRSIGIEVECTAIHEITFLPGILIKNGKLVVDEAKLLYPGDLLHEAGHLAVMPAEERKIAGGNVGEDKERSQAGGEEMMAIAWSYAALTHLGLSPQVVFHPNGYKGASDWYIEQYTNGRYIALPTLQWIGLCYDENNAHANNMKPYPHMIKWIRE